MLKKKKEEMMCYVVDLFKKTQPNERWRKKTPVDITYVADLMMALFKFLRTTLCARRQIRFDSYNIWHWLCSSSIHKWFYSILFRTERKKKQQRRWQSLKVSSVCFGYHANDAVHYSIYSMINIEEQKCDADLTK